MSEADDDETAAPGPAGREIWIEKYRPQNLDEVVGQDHIVERLQNYVQRDDLPNLLFSGPAGVGKCVAGETPVLTSRGIERIENVVGDVDGFGEPDDDLSVLSFDANGEFEFVEPSHVFSKEERHLRRVETRDGGTVTTTPEHRFLVIGDSGFEWQQAEDLSEGARIVRPLRTPLPETVANIDWIDEVDDQRVFATVTDEFAQEHDLPIEAENERTCSLSDLRALDVSRDSLSQHVERIQYTNANNVRSPSITPPSTVTPELAEFVGLAIAEARIENGRIKFYNRDPDLLERFDRIGRDLFDVVPSRGEQKDVPYVAFRTKTLTHYLEACFEVFDATVNGNGIGSTLLSAGPDSRRSFLRAVFDAEAYVTRTDGSGAIEVTQKNPRVITLLSYLLSGFGIPSRRTVERKAATNGSGIEREYHTLRISGASHLARFEETVGFSIDEKADRLAEHADGTGNPNHDTMPAQATIDDLCEELYLKKSTLVGANTDSLTRDRQAHLQDIDRLVEAATERIETAQRVQEDVDDLRRAIQKVVAAPATWAEKRNQLEPIGTRKTVEAETGIRSDYLLEYADGRRAPTSRRTGRLLSEISEVDHVPDVETVQERLQTAIESLGVPYERIADGTAMRGTDVINLLENENHDLASLPRFETVADRIVEVAAEMPTGAVLERLVTLDRLANGNLYFDEIRSISTVEEPRRVYDLTVPETKNYVGGQIPTVMHNTTSATAIAREIYGEDWREHFLELNASDDRGIDVVRGRIKDFARTSFGEYDFRIIFLDEADSLTDDAQSALRRTMEQFSGNTRFILSCNYSSQIIDPIQSRCAIFRFGPLSEAAVADYVRRIASDEGIEVSDDAVDALAYVADGDMRRAINALQAAAVVEGRVEEEDVYAITATARPEEIKTMIREAIDGDFAASRATLDELLTERGIAGGDVIDQVHRSVWEFDLDDEAAVRVLDRLGEADYRIAEGANERVQLEALLASLSLSS